MTIEWDGWTYGVEHEWADWDRTVDLPEGYGIDKHDVTIVNSNGIAADPLANYYKFGGEINTPPTDTSYGQLKCMEELINLFPEATINYRSNLHIHIRVPGLYQDLEALKQLQTFNHENLPEILPIIEPIPLPDEECPGSLRRYKRRKRSHHTVVSEERYRRQMKTASVRDFMTAEVPLRRTDFQPQWHLATRAAVNLRQLRETETIEFRHFPGTMNCDELLTALEWCRDYLHVAFGVGTNAMDLYEFSYKKRIWPKFLPYDDLMERKYRATCHDGTITKEQIVAAIKAIEEGTFV